MGNVVLSTIVCLSASVPSGSDCHTHDCIWLFSSEHLRLSSDISSQMNHLHWIAVSHILQLFMFILQHCWILHSDWLTDPEGHFLLMYGCQLSWPHYSYISSLSMFIYSWPFIVLLNVDFKKKIWVFPIADDDDILNAVTAKWTWTETTVTV